MVKSRNWFARISMAALTISIAACTSPDRHTGGPARNATYRTEDRADGFMLYVDYSRYQFIPETSSVGAACRSELLARAYEIAEGRGREIEQINEQRIRISFGRNGLTGITSCAASVPVEYKI